MVDTNELRKYIQLNDLTKDEIKELLDEIDALRRMYSQQVTKTISLLKYSRTEDENEDD